MNKTILADLEPEWKIIYETILDTLSGELFTLIEKLVKESKNEAKVHLQATEAVAKQEAKHREAIQKAILAEKRCNELIERLKHTLRFQVKLIRFQKKLLKFQQQLQINRSKEHQIIIEMLRFALLSNYKNYGDKQQQAIRQLLKKISTSSSSPNIHFNVGQVGQKLGDVSSKGNTTLTDNSKVG